jgi:hypothetical protein
LTAAARLHNRTAVRLYGRTAALPHGYTVGSMITKGQINPTSRASITASQAGENSQTNGSEHKIVYSILTESIKQTWSSKEATEEEQYRQASEAAEFEQRVSKF